MKKRFILFIPIIIFLFFVNPVFGSLPLVGKVIVIDPGHVGTCLTQ